MIFSTMIKRLNWLPYDQIRQTSPQNFEAVLTQDHLQAVQEVLEQYFGLPSKPSDQRPSPEDRAMAKSIGGIRSNQTLYCSARSPKREVAALWPWEDANHLTVKVLAGPGSSAAKVMPMEWPPAVEGTPELRAQTPEILIIGPKPLWSQTPRKIFEEAGFKIRVETIDPNFSDKFRPESDPAPAAVVFCLLKEDWLVREILARMKASWPETKLFIYAQEGISPADSLNIIRYADYFHRDHEDWPAIAERIKMMLPRTDAASGYNSTDHYKSVEK